MHFLILCKEQGYKDHDISKFKLALTKAEFLKSHKRKCGDSYFDHNLRVAEILADNKSSPEVIITGILQRCDLPDNILDSLFGNEVLKLMHGTEILRELTFKNKQLQDDAFRKMLLTTLKDIRVILVKLADKIDNLKSLHVFPESEQKRMAEEVLTIYAPLAYRLGVDRMKSKLEDLAFRVLNPRKYREIANFLEESSDQREENVNEFVNEIMNLSKNKVNIIKIKGRPKHIYSIYKKITRRGVKLDQQYDLLGIRVIVKDVKDCYIMLGLLHEKFQPVDGRLKDYIANPKPNSYRSIHTAVKTSSKRMVEVQIRTLEMDEFAEEGIAAHWRYKGMKAESSFEKKMSWLRNVLDMQKESKDFLETLKVDVFGDKIYCYTPKGDVKELPNGACVLDFAYLVHEHVGNTTVGGRVNGKFVPLKHKLKLGDVIEIVTNKNQRPRRGWIKLVKSPRARQKIRKSLKEYEHLPAFHYHKIKPLIKDEQGVLVESEEFPSATCVLAKCCYAIPGEDIVGLLTKRRIISVHRDDCRAAIKDQERWIPVNWKESFNQKIVFFIRATERSGLLADLLHTIASSGFEVKEAKAKMLGSDMAECSFTIIPRDLENLKRLIIRVNKVKGVRMIYFE